MSNSFKVAPMGSAAIVWTVTFVVGLLFFAWRVVDLGLSSLFDLGAAIVLLLLIVYAWFRSVRAYNVGNGDVVIVRAGTGRITIPVDNITRVEFKPEIGTFFNMSMLSIGGLFGWAGKTQVKEKASLNTMQAEVYGTNANNSVVMLLRSGRTLVLTPADPAGFVAAVQQAEGKNGGRPVAAGKWSGAAKKKAGRK